jgi:hypothetical protein
VADVYLRVAANGHDKASCTFAFGAPGADLLAANVRPRLGLRRRPCSKGALSPDARASVVRALVDFFAPALLPGLPLLPALRALQVLPAPSPLRMRHTRPRRSTSKQRVSPPPTPTQTPMLPLRRETRARTMIRSGTRTTRTPPPGSRFASRACRSCSLASRPGSVRSRMSAATRSACSVRPSSLILTPFPADAPPAVIDQRRRADFTALMADARAALAGVLGRHAVYA